jgi:hypothetical protein
MLFILSAILYDVYYSVTLNVVYLSFECPYFLEDHCKLQNGKCKPAIGKCILKGKLIRAKDINTGESSQKEND